MNHNESMAWYCARTKPKHEHLAAAHVAKNLSLEVFHPQLRVQRNTQRGLVRVIEPLFPCYIFVRCVIEECQNEIQYANGVQSLLHFGNRIPKVGDNIIAELKQCFSDTDVLTVTDQIVPGDEITIGDGAFAGMRAQVLRLLPARKRVQVLLEVLGGPTPVEVDRSSVVSAKHDLAALIPVLAASGRRTA
jgi:transcriptional antiterminator RfaH